MATISDPITVIPTLIPNMVIVTPSFWHNLTTWFQLLQAPFILSKANFVSASSIFSPGLQRKLTMIQ